MSRQADTPTNESSLAGVESLLEQLQHVPDSDHTNAEPSSGSSPDNNSQRRRMSTNSEGYPSWLPKRPLHPAPASTFHSERDVPPATPGPDAGPSGASEPPPPVGGRKATPRSVRIVSLQQDNEQARLGREATDLTTVAPRVWSRGMGTPLPVTIMAEREKAADAKARFRARGLQLELLRAPSPWMRLYFVLWPLLILAHIPLQTFLDFNAVFVIIQIALHPGPTNSRHNWTLAAAAYIACWALWLGAVVLVYELVYSFPFFGFGFFEFWDFGVEVAAFLDFILLSFVGDLGQLRFWAVTASLPGVTRFRPFFQRPPMLALYLSAPGSALVGMTSYTNFCFMQRLRWGALFESVAGYNTTQAHERSESDNPNPKAAHGRGYSSATAVNASGDVLPAFGTPSAQTRWRVFLAESSARYAQNVPTVALLLPRAGICLVVLFGFWGASAGQGQDGGAPSPSLRDATFFHANGALTDYARGVLSANAAWAAWRALVCLAGWLGLWFFSGAPCAGLCGPRHRWEEAATEKSTALYADDLSDTDPLPWQWREDTARRVRRTYEFCVNRPPSGVGGGGHRKREGAEADTSELLGAGPLTPAPEFEGMEQVMAAIGFPMATAPPTTAKRGALTGELFESPIGEIPKVAKRSSRDREKVVYPFTGPSAQVSSRDRVPFPPSPGPLEPEETSGSGSLEEAEDGEELEEDEEDEDDDDDEELEEDDEEEEEDEEGELPGSEEPSSGRASGSMSSLGQPVTSRYPFQFRRPARGASASSHSHTHSTSNTNTHTRSTGTRGSVSVGTRGSARAQSRVSQSTGNVESSSSGQSPHSARTTSSQASVGPRYNSAGAASGVGIAMPPMPPRHPQQAQGRGRTRAGTVPVPSSSSSLASVSVSVQPPVDFPRSATAGTGVGAAGMDALGVRERMDSATSTFGAGPQPGAPHGSEHEGHPHGEDAPESEGSHEGEREDRVGLLSSSNSPSAGPSPKSSLSALRQRASNMSLSPHRRGYTHSHHSGSGSGSRSGSASGAHSRTQSSHSGSSRSRAASISISIGGVSAVRERAQSLLQGISAAASSGELVQRLRANSSMARLEEDNSDARTTNTHSRNGSDARTTNTHSRNGSGTGSDAMPSSGGENNTFGHPLRSTWHNASQQQLQERQQQPTPVDEGSEEGEAHELHPAQSRTSVFSAPSSVLSDPSFATAHQPSPAPSEERLQAEPAGIPIPTIRAAQGQAVGSSPSSYGDAETGVSSSYPDISTAPQSFVTAAPTVEGSTTESSGGRTDGLESWGFAAGAAHMRDPSRGGGHGHGAWGHHGPA
ncbi:hypothetical protein K438DRAFT_1759631 [Mycena galopus ATCC 62051]|nr:hypothetical protein K438DRAFT_1759631 [Mycena galopus ATCC 62051]